MSPQSPDPKPNERSPIRPGHNTVIFCGCVSRGPELRRTPQGTAVGTFTLTIPGEPQGRDKADDLVIEVVMFRALAEHWGVTLTAGMLVVVEGALAQRRWRGAGGLVQNRYEVVASRILTLSSSMTR